jgi:hypothetical protein
MLSSEIDSVVFYTRFGIGVSDERWLDYRIGLFEAVTLPSIARFCAAGAQWYVFTDLWMREGLHVRLQRAIDRVDGSGNIRIVPLPIAAYMAPTLATLVAERELVSMVRIDDDDALSSDYFNLVPSGPGLSTVGHGYEALMTERKMRAMDHPFHSMNTVFTGTPDQVEDFARVGHHRIDEWGKKVKAKITVVETEAFGFLYARHKLADSGFGSIRRTILEDEATVPLSNGWRRRFGFDEDLFQQWRQLDRETPKLSEAKTWLRGGNLMTDAAKLSTDLAEVQRGIRASTADLLLDESTPPPAAGERSLADRARAFLRNAQNR